MTSYEYYLIKRNRRINARERKQHPKDIGERVNINDLGYPVRIDNSGRIKDMTNCLGLTFLREASGYPFYLIYLDPLNAMEIPISTTDHELGAPAIIQLDCEIYRPVLFCANYFGVLREPEIVKTTRKIAEKLAKQHKSMLRNRRIWISKLHNAQPQSSTNFSKGKVLDALF